MPSELLDWLQRSALAATLAIVVVLILRGLWLRWLGARSLLWLWLLVPALVIAVTVPARVVRMPAEVSKPATTTHVAPPSIFAIASQQPQPLATQAQSWTTRTTELLEARLAEIEIVLIATWSLGAMLLALRLLRQQRDFVRALGTLLPRADGSWMARSSDFGPVVVGLLKPRIVVPADFEFRYDAHQRGLILAHERCHLRRGDLRVNFLLCVLRCVYWFNPLVHLAARRLRFDQELACDAAVLEHFPHSRRAYADAILNTQLADLGLPVGCYWQSSHPLKWRIIMLTKPTAGLARVMLGSLIAIAGSTIAAVSAWAALPEYVGAPSAPVAAADPGQPQVAATPAAMKALPAGRTAPAPGATPQPTSAADAAPAAAAVPALQPSPAADAAPAIAPAPVVQPTPAADVAPAVAPVPVGQPTPAIDAVPAVAPTPVVQPAPRSDRALRVNPAPTPRIFATPAEWPVPMLAALDSRSGHSVHELVAGALQTTSVSTPEAAQGAPELQDEIELPILLQIDWPRFPRGAGRTLASGSGQVIVSVELDERGKLIDAAISESDLGSAFDKSALKAVAAARFAPARKNGVPVSSTALVPVVFTVVEMASRREIDPFTPPNMHKPRYYSQRNDYYGKKR
jgi:bla regulator protein blaR1